MSSAEDWSATATSTRIPGKAGAPRCRGSDRSKMTRSELAVFKAFIHQCVRHSPEGVETSNKPLLSWHFSSPGQLPARCLPMMLLRTSKPGVTRHPEVRCRSPLLTRRFAASALAARRRPRRPARPEGWRGLRRSLPTRSLELVRGPVPERPGAWSGLTCPSCRYEPR